MARPLSPHQKNPSRRVRSDSCLNRCRQASNKRTTFVYCEVTYESITISVSTAMGNLAMYRISFAYTRGGRGSQRQWFRCPRCGRRMFKLYRPPGSPFFACRQCHDLTYRCLQEHDPRLDWLVKAPIRRDHEFRPQSGITVVSAGPLLAG
jgi:hypothetical protein